MTVLYFVRKPRTRHRAASLLALSHLFVGMLVVGDVVGDNVGDNVKPSHMHHPSALDPTSYSCVSSFQPHRSDMQHHPDSGQVSAGSSSVTSERGGGVSSAEVLASQASRKGGGVHAAS